jgi:MFS family permease
MPLTETSLAQVSRVRLVGAMGIGQILAWSSTYYLPAVLVSPISQATGWSVTSVVIGLSLGLLVAGACSPKVGRMIDRHGGRSILAASSLLMALGLALMGTAQHLAIYYLAWTIIGFAMAAGLYDAAFATLGRLMVSERALHLAGGYPVVRQQLGQSAGLLRRQSCEHILEIGIRIMPIHARRLDQAHDCRRPFAAA